MLLEKGQNGVLVSVDAGGITLKARMSVCEAEKERISPASEVRLGFKADDVRWI